VSQINSSTDSRDLSDVQLRVSAYDNVASMLIALLILAGSVVGLLFILWFSSRVFFVPGTVPEIVAVEMEVDAESGTQNPPGTGRDMNEPGAEELGDLAEPDVKDALHAVTDAVSSVAASLDVLESTMSTRGSGGVGDNRRPGVENGVIPRWQRWEIRYSSTTLQDYQQQLEFFQIELGALGGGRPGVDYVYFQNGSPRKRSVSEGKDERLYFIWQGGRFREQDRAIMSATGVATTGRVLCQFYPKELENQLAALERAKMGNRRLRDVQKTFFGIQGNRGNFQFYVIDIRWRTP
jgi:hypothetical protein